MASAAVDLMALVDAGDVAAVTAACRAADGPDGAAAARAEVVTRCLAIARKGFWTERGPTAEQHDAAVIVLCRLATVAELARLRRWRLPKDATLAVELLSSRGRDWCTAWAATAFERIDPREARIARQLEVHGLAVPQVSDGRTLSLVSFPGAFDATAPLGDGGWPGHAAVLDVLRANPDLLEREVWHLFVVEGGGEHSLAAHDKYCAPDAGWLAALVTLAAEGRLDRDRLLDAGLDALQRGFAAFRAQWFGALHEALQPTIDERASRAPTYLALASSLVGATASLALRALAQLDAAGRLDPVEVVAELGPALLAPAKGTARRAITLLAHAVDAAPGCADGASTQLVEALGHPAREVQADALALLMRWCPTPAPALAAVAAERAPGCHPAVRDELARWLDASGGDSGAPSPERRVSARAAPRLRRVPTIADALDPARALAPVDGIDELVELAASAVEAPGDPDDLERLLAGLAACDRTRLRTDGRAATVARRATAIAGRDRPAAQLVARAVVAAFDPPALGGIDDARVRVRGGRSALAIEDLLVARARAVEARLAAETPAPLLSVPTHRGGVLDPGVLAERLARTDVAASDPDLQVALLRVAPDRAGLELLAAALPDDRRATAAVRAWCTAWASVVHDDRAGSVSWSAPTQHHGEYAWCELSVDGIDAAVRSTGLRPMRVVVGRWGGRFAQDPAGVAWMGSIVPWLPSAWARLGVATIGATAGVRDVAHGDVGYLERWFDPAVPWTDAVHLLVALALDDARSGVAAAAVDLAVAGWRDGRVDASVLGRHVGALASTAAVTPARWGRTLGEVAATGPDERDAVVEALVAAVAVAEPPRPQTMLALLELLESLVLDTGATIDDPSARAALARCTGGGKTAKVAARLLALEAR